MISNSSSSTITEKDHSTEHQLYLIFHKQTRGSKGS